MTQLLTTSNQTEKKSCSFQRISIIYLILYYSTLNDWQSIKSYETDKYEKYPNWPKNKKSTEPEIEIIQVLKLSVRDFKQMIVFMLNDLKEIVDKCINIYGISARRWNS